MQEGEFNRRLRRSASFISSASALIVALALMAVADGGRRTIVDRTRSRARPPSAGDALRTSAVATRHIDRDATAETATRDAATAGAVAAGAAAGGADTCDRARRCRQAREYEAGPDRDIAADRAAASSSSEHRTRRRTAPPPGRPARESNADTDAMRRPKRREAREVEGEKGEGRQSRAARTSRSTGARSKGGPTITIKWSAPASRYAGHVSISVGFIATVRSI